MADPRSDTATLEAARAHARQQAAAAASAGDGRVLPVEDIADLPVPSDARPLWDETIPGGNVAARRLPRGARLRIADRTGDACVQLLAYHARNPTERLNVADTVKVQWQAYLGPDAVLLSDMGRVLLSIVADDSGRHDCLCGASNLATATARYGDGALSGPTPNARDLLAVAAAKHGLGRVDIGPSINLFKSARVGDDGALTFDGTPTRPTTIELQAELDVLVVLATTPHVLDPRPDYPAAPVRCTAWLPPTPDTRVRSTSPERERAFRNTDDHLLELTP